MKLRDIIAVPFWLVGGVFLYLAVRIGGTFTASMVARNERETLITKRNTNNLESTNQEYIDSKVKDFDLANSEVVEEYDNGKKVRKGLSPELLNSLRKTLQDVENHNAQVLCCRRSNPNH